MGLFNRGNRRQDSDNANDDSPENKKAKGGWKRPANTAFKQQRLKAWQPILTPKTVLPTFFIVAILFAPIGGLLIWGSSLVTEITLDYTECENLAAATSLDGLQFSQLPTNRYSYRLRAKDSGSSGSVTAPQYALLNNTGNSSVTNVQQEIECHLQFDIPADLQQSVLFYYRLSNFFQNHRRYVKSYNTDQLSGEAVSAKDLENSDCKPLASIDGKPVYPCGLIANSLFNDTFSNLRLLNPPGNAADQTEYILSDKNIAWPGERKKYVDTPGYDFSAIVPPPNWAKRYPNNYTNENPPPNLRDDQRFQNWMRTAGLPTFSKLYGRNDTVTLSKGRYEVIIGLNYPVQKYKGTKSIVISTVSWIGGKNPFLGWAYVAASGVFIVLAVAGTVRHLVRPRRLGDMSLLSWNR
ncbi:hypothetical protein HGRIS_013406 [Hohenbuehelia grisea]|uniref:Cell cycle control protein n=1 Tax=Hohenbuehelia grisea TaxID=104357 RepID=A0ABR3IVE4_9AGAR